MVTPSWGTFQRPNENQKLEIEEQRERSQEIPGDIIDKELPEGQKPQWGNFQSPTTYQGPVDPTADESTLEYFIRNAASNASRVVEQVAGRHGNLEKFAKDTLTNVPQSGGILGWAISQLVGPEKWERMVRGPKDQEQLLPTSQQLKEASQIVSGGYTKPKTKGEEKFQEFTEDVGALAGGRKQPNLVGSSVAQRARQLTYNKLLIPAAANVAKRIVADTGFGEDKGNIAKMAVWLPLTLAGNISAPQYASHLMNQGRQGLPNTLQANVPRFTQSLNRVENTLLTSDPRTALARQVLGGLRNDIANGQTNAQSLLTMYDAVNATKRNRGLFELGRTDQGFARRSIDQVRDAVRNEIMQVGSGHPQALEDWQNGVRAWSVIHQSNALKNWVEGVAKGPYSKLLAGPTAALFGIGSFGASKAPLTSVTSAVALPIAYKTGQAIYRMYQDPRLANYYWQAVGAAMEENLPSFISNYQKLDKAMEKSESRNPKNKSKKD